VEPDPASAAHLRPAPSGGADEQPGSGYKTETRPFDPEAEPEFTPKAESPSDARQEDPVQRTENRGDSSRDGLPMWVFGLASAAAFVLLMWVLVRRNS
jgi:hypothetical protein